MNFSTFERAELASFAYRQARHTGSLQCMKAICYVIRNRVRAGWGDGTWLYLIEHAPSVQGNLDPCHSAQELAAGVHMIDPKDRNFQLLVRDIDDIYLGNSIDDTRTVVQDALYYQFINKPPSDWFVSTIVRDNANHPRIGQVGTIALFK